MATDWQPYAEHMLEQVVQSGGWQNLGAPNGYADRPDYRPITKFENAAKISGMVCGTLW